MPVIDLKETPTNTNYSVYLPHQSGLDVEVSVNLTSSGEGYWVGGRDEPWSLEVAKEPEFEIVSSVICDGEDTPYNLNQKALQKVLDLAANQFWENYE